MTSIAHPPYDVYGDPFVKKGFDLFDTLQLECGTTCFETSNPDYPLIAYDAFYLTFDADLIDDKLSEVIQNTFADKRNLKPFKTFVKNGKRLLFVYFQENHRKIDELFKPFFWDNERTLDKRLILMSDLEKMLVDYFYQHFCF